MRVSNTLATVILLIFFGCNQPLLTPPETKMSSPFSAPVAGTEITFSDITSTSMILSWGAAQSTASTRSVPLYRLVRSAEGPQALDTVEKALAIQGADVLLDWQPGITAFFVDNLNPDQEYAYSVLVRSQDSAPAQYSSSRAATNNRTAPVPGTAITAGTVTETSVALSWGRARDDRTSTSNLRYRLVMSTVAASAIDTVAEALTVSGSGIVKDWTANLTSFTVTGLQSSTRYHFAVLVRDSANNTALYSPLSVTTAAPAVDSAAPVPGTAPAVTLSSSSSLSLGWGASADNTTPAAQLQYKLVRDTVSATLIDSVAEAQLKTGSDLLLDWTVGQLTFTAGNLAASTTYHFAVLVRDLTGNINIYPTVTGTTQAQQSTGTDWAPLPALPKLPVGTNLPAINYYEASQMFSDVMTTASNWITTWQGSGSPWDSGMAAELKLDADGYPLGLPQLTSDGRQTIVRFLINNFYTGQYRLDYTGSGTFAGNAYQSGGNWYVNLNGSGGNVWIDITSSDPANPVRGLHIVPASVAKGSLPPTFLPAYLDGLRTFHALRLMDPMRTNNSLQVKWTDRVPKTYYTQSGRGGIAQEYLIQLCNELQADAWICVPHAASDDYIRQMARLWRDNLNPNLKIYVEYSNELWNTMFTQFDYLNNNAPGAVDAYVPAGLASVPDNYLHYKFAWMMARTFRLFNEEFTGQQDRIITVGTGQHRWVDMNFYILKYLFDIDGKGCEAYAVGGYFDNNDKDKQRWIADPTTTGGPAGILDAAYQEMYRTTLDPAVQWDNIAAQCTRQVAAFIHARGIPFLVYEGGQHMQPLNQQDYPYNLDLWEAQIHPKMYELYLRNFAIHTEAAVDCQLFMSYTYLGERKSKYGSWGTLEAVSQIGSNYASTAPKFQALLDVNTPK